jgi:hypothetical protein
LEGTKRGINRFSLGLLFVCHALISAIVSPKYNPIISNRPNEVAHASRAKLALAQHVFVQYWNSSGTKGVTPYLPG